ARRDRVLLDLDPRKLRDRELRPHRDRRLVLQRRVLRRVELELVELRLADRLELPFLERLAERLLDQRVLELLLDVLPEPLLEERPRHAPLAEPGERDRVRELVIVLLELLL